MRIGALENPSPLTGASWPNHQGSGLRLCEPQRSPASAPPGINSRSHFGSWPPPAKSRLGSDGAIKPPPAETSVLTCNGANPLAGVKTNGSASAANAAADSAERIRRCIAFMLEHLDLPLQVATLAAKAHTSPSHFFVLFKRHTGSSPIDYFIGLRMQRACELLDEGSLHIKEVAAALGYDDPFYFSRLFKSVNRVAPSEYRARRTGEGRTDGEARMMPSERGYLLSQPPVLRLIENNRGSKSILHEKNSILHSKEECMA